MKHVLIIAVASVGVAELLNTSVSEPGAWAVGLAGIAGSGLIGRRRPKKSIGMEERGAPLITQGRAPSGVIR
jgi:MYXO-CTERM domain-containing protein